MQDALKVNNELIVAANLLFSSQTTILSSLLLCFSKSASHGNSSVSRSQKKEKREREMCPLRVLLIFLSATLAGFFVIRNLKTQPELNEEQQEEDSAPAQLPLSTKVRSAIGTGFWTCVDMASGRYLWRIVMAPAAVEKIC
ncbi:unnamed protein product [Musa acuminata subsp. burmannicoides]